MSNIVCDTRLFLIDKTITVYMLRITRLRLQGMFWIIMLGFYTDFFSPSFKASKSLNMWLKEPSGFLSDICMSELKLVSLVVTDHFLLNEIDVI